MNGNDLTPLGVWAAKTGIEAISITPNGTQIVSVSRDGDIEIWDIEREGAMPWSLSGDNSKVLSVAFSSDGTRVISGSSDKTIIIWDVQSGEVLVGPLQGQTDRVQSVAFSLDDTRFVSGSADGTLLVWDTYSGSVLVGPLKGHSQCVLSVAFSPDGTRVVSGSEDNTVRIWDAQTGDSIGEPLEGHTDMVLSVAISPNGRHIASSSIDSTIRIWDIQTGAEVLKPLEGHTSWVFSVAFSPDGARIVSGSDDCTIRIWDAYTGDALAERIKAHTDTINSVAFCLDGACVASGSNDGTIRMWRTQQRSQPQQLSNTSEHTPLPDSVAGMAQSLSHARENLIKTLVEIASRKMSARDMFDCLIEHGCTDLSLRMDPRKYSSVAMAGGSFGDIWRGILRDGTEVAIKCLRFHSIAEDDTKGRKRAMRELYMWSKAKHDNVQELLGAIMFQGRLGMVSPWMKHGNLQEYLRRHPDVDRYQLCIDVATGVSYLHDINMVHGDLKACNILVSQEGVAKISDFDHSILSDPTLVFSATTNVGGGTLRWMAPELLSSSDDNEDPPAKRTKQTDIYALGITMLEIISGHIPYVEYRNDMGIYRTIDQKKPPNRPTELLNLDERADQMWALLLKCWDHDFAARPEATALLKSLRVLTIGTAPDS